MTRVTRTRTSASFGVTLDLSGATVVDVANASSTWVTGLEGVVITGMAVVYTEAGAGGITGASIVGVDVQVGGEGSGVVYELVDDGQASIEYTLGAATKRYIPFVGTNAVALNLAGIDALRVRYTVLGADGADTEALKITFIGHVAGTRI